MEKKIVPYSAILQMNGFKVLKTSGSDEIITYCPHCKSDNFWVNESKNTGHCWACDKSFNAIAFHAEVNGLEYKDALKEVTNNNGYQAVEYKEFNKQQDAVSEVAPIDIRSKTYSCLFKQLGLAPDHAENLKERGLNSDLLFKTFDYSESEQKKIVDSLINSGCELKEVPPFYMLNGKYRIKKLQRGILVPYLDRKGRIQGFQLRVDDDKLKPFKGKDGLMHEPSKYIWVSTKSIPKGAKYGVKAETFISYCCSFRKDKDGSYYPFFPGDTVAITEGAMKGTIAHQLSGKAFLAIPGVNSGRSKLEKELAYLKERGVKYIELCFDMDMLLNDSVLKALDKLKKLITDNGMDYRTVVWNTEYADFNGTHHQFDVETDFVFTPKTVRKFKEKNRLDVVVKEVKEMNRNVFFAFKNKQDALDNKDMFIRLKESLDIDITPVIWSLKLKGIDNYYAYSVKNIL